MGRPDTLWEPPEEAWDRSRLADFARSAGAPSGGYAELYAWSLADVDRFWTALAGWADLGAGGGPALASAQMPGAVWFPERTWNYAEVALRSDHRGPALLARSQTRPPVELTWAELRDQVARARAGLARLGVGRGDRVAGYLPNIPEAVVAFLAAASLGAVWTSAPPEFGVKAVVDRFSQVEPTVLVAVEDYQYGDRRIDRRDHLERIRAALPSLAATVIVPYPDVTAPGALAWDQLLDGGEAEPAFEPVPFSHPLYVLYSSGTTGPPKAIVHGHGGILCEHVKALALHGDLGPGDRFFWFSTTGWMMWNYLVSGLAVGAAVVLFDGDPGHPDLGALWRLAAETGTTFFGVSAPYLEACRRAELRPADAGDLSALAAIGSTGAPLSPAAATWATGAAGRPIPVLSISGGTDVCTAFVGGSRVLPVRAGEMACRYLGAAVEAWADGGPVVGQRGELVLTAPMPSMPVGFWGDDDGSRMRAAYFAEHPGVWTHGDWITVNEDGSCVITGRADATLNRGGVRLGTAEIYAVLEGMPEVADSLVVHLDGSGRDELVLFLVPADGVVVDDALRARVRGELRGALSPRHAPDRIEEVAAVPRTLSGKKLEVPIKRILSGEPADTVLSRDTLANPEALDAFLTEE